MDGWDADGDGAVVYADPIQAPQLSVSMLKWENSFLRTSRLLELKLHWQVVIIKLLYYEPLLMVMFIYQRRSWTSNRIKIIGAVIVEPEERFTNVMEYNARDRDGDGIIRKGTNLWYGIQMATV